MKLLIAIFVCVCVSTVLTRSVDEGLDEKLVNKGWEKLLIKIANVDPNDLVLKNHLIQYLENYEKTKANEAKDTSMYLGCFKDHRRTRMFRGFAEISNKQMTPQACIDTCHYRRYAYAGAQSGDQCYCGNTRPGTSANAKVNDSDCKDNCSGDKSKKCGGGWLSSVYTTGITVTRQDKNGFTIGESDMYSKSEWERH